MFMAFKPGQLKGDFIRGFWRNIRPISHGLAKGTSARSQKWVWLQIQGSWVWALTQPYNSMAILAFLHGQLSIQKK